jgi:two-component system, cell cycle sensor histidine kinase and response regulator CckA
VLAAANSGPIDLLVTDLVMPGIGGLMLAERLSSSRPDMQVLFITGYAPEAVDRHGELAAAGALLEKPFSADQLARKVRDVLACGH